MLLIEKQTKHIQS